MGVVAAFQAPGSVPGPVVVLMTPAAVAVAAAVEPAVEEGPAEVVPVAAEPAGPVAAAAAVKQQEGI